VVAACEVNGVNPFEYLPDALLRVSVRSVEAGSILTGDNTHPADRIDDLLPDAWKPVQEP